MDNVIKTSVDPTDATSLPYHFKPFHFLTTPIFIARDHVCACFDYCISPKSNSVRFLMFCFLL